MPDTLITVENVSKKFCRSLKRSLWYGMQDLGAELVGRHNGYRELRKEEFWAIQDVSLELKRGDTLGLIGRNGAGKTTLLRMLNGLIKPDSGRIEIRGRMQALIALGAGFNPVLTGRENIYVNAAVLGIPKREVDHQFDAVVDFAGVEEFIDAPVQSYSSGMTVRLGFAVAAHMNPDILLVDEVLAVGDEGFQSKCLNKIGELKQMGTAIILVSHSMHTISTFASQIVFMEDGKHHFFNNVSEGIREYRKLFAGAEISEIQKVCNGNDKINFFQIDVPKQEFYPGETFSISLQYEASVVYYDAEVDIKINSSNETAPHFQATNRAHGQEINLLAGINQLKIEVEDIKINNASVRIAISIWAKDRSELLFWCRVPIEFKGIDHSTGSSFLNVSYKSRTKPD